ncbi:hypothetical protein [Halobellus limi]|uniref:Uncharacterized protein n=1 Tax=Halobellus limi TaxID=699433 RepID=A0A1H6CLP8_9EURY|nr:hypothetical protein [Halobellus limi]SEG73623.1 hypothetical protein SAMN04488133_3517 [Halobellus limi]
MPSRHPFVDAETGTLDRDQILAEAVPLARLLLYVGLIALVPFALAYFFGGSIVGALLAAAGQFVLAVGAGVVLIYVVVRAIDIAGVPRGDGDGRGAAAEVSDRHNFDGDEEETERAERERRDPDSDPDGSER